MNLEINPVNCSLNDDLKTHVSEKMNKFFGHYDYITSAIVYLKHEENADENDYKVEGELHLPGQELYADTWASSFESGLTDTIQKLRRQLEKYKETHYRSNQK